MQVPEKMYRPFKYATGYVNCRIRWLILERDVSGRFDACGIVRFAVGGARVAPRCDPGSLKESGR